MNEDNVRKALIIEQLNQEGFDAIVCTLPTDVVMLSGYWPVTGTAIAVATKEGQIGVVVPEDETQLARDGWADPLIPYQPGSLSNLDNFTTAAREPLALLLKRMGLSGGKIGYRHGPTAEPSAYAAIHLFGFSIIDLIRELIPDSDLMHTDGLVYKLCSIKTPDEREKIRRACRIAEAAYLKGVIQLKSGLWETEASSYFQQPLSTVGVGFGGARRADGFVYCMSGEDSYFASGAYARSRSSEIQEGNLCLVHCNSYADGFWTDITRTFFIGEPDTVTKDRFNLIMKARSAALNTIQPGVRASEVDRAAREIFENAGLGSAFKHATGHGVGFAAFDPQALPRIHPMSPDILECGMVFNIEPALYIEGWGGLRHCDMVAITEEGTELLTPFLSDIDSLVCIGADHKEGRQ